MDRLRFEDGKLLVGGRVRHKYFRMFLINKLYIIDTTMKLLYKWIHNTIYLVLPPQGFVPMMFDVVDYGKLNRS